MNCPCCDSGRIGVVCHDPAQEGDNAVVRWRKCRKCDARFKTVERVVRVTSIVKDGKRVRVPKQARG